jgi:hypothetical protein
MYKVPVKCNMRRNSQSMSLVGAPALALVAHSLLNDVLVGIALLTGLETTFGLLEVLSVTRIVTLRIHSNLPVFPR